MPKIYKRYEVPPHKGLSCRSGLTQQQFKDECDINNIVKRMAPSAPPPAVYGDVSMFDGLQSAIDMVDSANDAFMNLPAKVRDDFGHNPVAFFNFANNPANKEYLYDHGLAVRPKVSPTQETPSVPPSPAPQVDKSGNSSS